MRLNRCLIRPALTEKKFMAKEIKRKRRSIIQTWRGNRPPMKHSDFRIGCEFLTGSGRWRCTDVGKRTITAIRLDHDDDPSWYVGPPYALAEDVFDEYDIEGCEPAPRRRTHDASGLAHLKIVKIRRANGVRKRRSAQAKAKSGRKAQLVDN